LANKTNRFEIFNIFAVFYQWQIGKIVVEPFLEAAWETRVDVEGVVVIL
jgi:hypothetical protein